LRSGTGNDVVIGGGGGDYIKGDKGNDVLEGSAGPDRVLGGDGDDTVAGGTGGDDLSGDGGNDIVIPGPGSDTASAGPSIYTDLVTYFDAKKPVRIIAGTVLGSGQDELYGFAWVEGTEHDDTIERTGSVVFGLGGDDRLIGSNNTTGVDIYVPGAGDDTVSGGGGYDYVSYVDATGGVNVRLDDGLATGYGSDSLTGVEGIEGSFFDDTLRGDDNPNGIYGLDGDDLLFGLSNDDFLDGGDGVDDLDGGSGADECIAGEATTSCETVGAAFLRPTDRVETSRSASPAMRALRGSVGVTATAQITRQHPLIR
jgi:Ca2+-binding RTX toxin-like protein